eukprot:3928269-Rhodomonas_salina.1
MLADMMLPSVSLVGVTNRHAPATLRDRGWEAREHGSVELGVSIDAERSVFENTRFRCRRDGLRRS